MNKQVLKYAILEELDDRLHSALNYPVRDEFLGNSVPYDTTDEGAREAESIKELISKGIDNISKKTLEEFKEWAISNSTGVIKETRFILLSDLITKIEELVK